MIQGKTVDRNKRRPPLSSVHLSPTWSRPRRTGGARPVWRWWDGGVGVGGAGGSGREESRAKLAPPPLSLFTPRCASPPLCRGQTRPAMTHVRAEGGGGGGRGRRERANGGTSGGAAVSSSPARARCHLPTHHTLVRLTSSPAERSSIVAALNEEEPGGGDCFSFRKPETKGGARPRLPLSWGWEREGRGRPGDGWWRRQAGGGR